MGMSKDLEAFLARKAGFKLSTAAFVSFLTPEKKSTPQIKSPMHLGNGLSAPLYRYYKYIYVYMVQKSNLDLITLLV